MSISVALCTYNGEQYLNEQLASIAAQTRLPDEVVICDDASTDATAAIVRNFAAEAPFAVKFSVNPIRLGSTQNFDHAIRLCQGELIFLADQDDVWKPHKLATLAGALSDSSAAGFVFSDAEMVATDLSPLGYTLWDAIRFSRAERQRMRAGRNYEVLLKHYVVTGATMAFHSKYKELVLPIPPAWVHDAWIALLIAAVAPCASINESLIQYRQHSRQQFGEKKRNLYQQYLVAKTMTQASYRTVADTYSLASDRLKRISQFEVPQTHLAALDGKITHFQIRTRMRDHGVWRLPLVAREIVSGRYQRFSLGWKSIAQDLFI